MNPKERDFFSLLPGERASETGIHGAPSTAASWHGLAADPSRATMFAFALFLLAPLPWIIAYFLPPVNHDAAALLHFAQRWLEGERLYVDLIDINPPLVFILNLVPAAIAKFTPIAAPSALMMCVLAWVACGFLLSWRLLRTAPGSVGEIQRYVLPPLFLFLMIVYPGSEFAQREHLATVAALPYLLLAQARLEGRTVLRSLAIATALFAAVAFSLKPHFLLLPLLVETMVLHSRGLRRGLRDPVLVTLGLVFLTYAAYVLLITPAYLGFVVPLVMDKYLGLGGLGPWGVLFNSPLTAPVAILIPLAGASLVMRRPLARLVAIAAVAAAVTAMVQGKGWPYHVLPAESFVLLLAAVLLCEFLDARVPAVHQRRSLTLMTFLVSIMLGSYCLSLLTRPTFTRQAGFEQSQAGQLLQRFGKQAAEGPILSLSPGIYPHFPLVNYAGTKMAMRFMSLWLIQGAYEKCLPDGRMFRSPQEMSPAEAFAFKAVAEDFNRYRPKLVFVDKQPGILMCAGKDFDYLAYFRRHPLFESNWHRYRLQAEFDRYWVYVRR